MADVCCDWQLYLPFAAFVVSSMDPSIVLEHCHNNGWLSLSHNGPFANICQHSPTMKKGRQLAYVWLMFIVIGGCSCLLLPLWFLPWTPAMFWNTATIMVGSPCLTMAHLSIFANTLHQ